VYAANRHLDDDALTRRYLVARGLAALDAGDEALLQHLGQCPACEARYAALLAALEDAREAVLADASGACAPDRMERQHERIMRRVDALHAGPRVLPFPAAAPHPQPAPRPWVFRRWVAIAAAAGLVVGLTAGRLLFDGGTRTTAVARPQAAPAAAMRPVPTLRALNADAADSDDQFLSEIELATAAPRTRELRAIYAFTLEESRDLPRGTGKD
jgi:hypothetical protein